MQHTKPMELANHGTGKPHITEAFPKSTPDAVASHAQMVIGCVKDMARMTVEGPV